MRPHRRDGRLVVEAVSVPSQNYLHAQLVDGRLLLSFIEATYGDEFGYGETNDASKASTGSTLPQNQDDITQFEVEEEEEKEKDVNASQITEEGERELDEEKCFEEEELEKICHEEEEVEVVDRGTVVEVKVSIQPQQQSGSMKVHRSSLVINKFVGCMPHSDSTDCVQTREEVDKTSFNGCKHKHTVPSTPSPRRVSPPTTSTTAAASTLGSYSGLWSSVQYSISVIELCLLRLLFLGPSWQRAILEAESLGEQTGDGRERRAFLPRRHR